jgi:hypothetical protein
VDHVGFAERLRHDHGVPVWVSDADAAEARGEVPKPKAAIGPVRLLPTVQFLAYAALRGGLRSTPVRRSERSEQASRSMRGLAASHRFTGPHSGSVAFYMQASMRFFWVMR